MQIHQAYEIVNPVMPWQSRLIWLLLVARQVHIQHAFCKCSHDFQPKEKRHANGISLLQT
jgi:hypothetical protein